jgi:hypothetical protein
VFAGIKPLDFIMEYILAKGARVSSAEVFSRRFNIGHVQKISNAVFCELIEIDVNTAD